MCNFSVAGTSAKKKKKKMNGTLIRFCYFLGKDLNFVYYDEQFLQHPGGMLFMELLDGKTEMTDTTPDPVFMNRCIIGTVADVEYEYNRWKEIANPSQVESKNTQTRLFIDAVLKHQQPNTGNNIYEMIRTFSILNYSSD